ncbi:hypothetical protein CYMTET_24021 [Cymbomonas tetramitiformis]|uniref:Structure-specific endonuclease subunit SLX1 homolog n=1 Tax=Cymbomonas tetramitiformis TaxID=36881 RepID=A0AAE0FXJ9_9CHLO|nr:hypothetical protein CYMTET_24021 [Cymbomonas tetramitiformis]
MLISINPTKRGRTYIGFTVNPERRIRQHNGEIANGAKQTQRLRPCEMVCLVHGFPTQVQALQFEWAWQNPKTSRAVREVARRLKISDRSYNVKHKVRLLFEMLRLPTWCRMPLSIRFLSSKYASLQESCPRLASHNVVDTGSLAALREVYTLGEEEEDDAVAENFTCKDGGESDNDSYNTATSREGRSRGVCSVCGGSISNRYLMCECSARSHVLCLAQHFLTGEEAPVYQLLPNDGSCPSCLEPRSWGDLLASTATARARGAPQRDIMTTIEEKNADSGAMTSCDRERARVENWACDPLEFDESPPIVFNNAGRCEDGREGGRPIAKDLQGVLLDIDLDDAAALTTNDELQQPLNFDGEGGAVADSPETLSGTTSPYLGFRPKAVLDDEGVDESSDAQSALLRTSPPDLPRSPLGCLHNKGGEGQIDMQVICID